MLAYVGQIHNLKDLKGESSSRRQDLDALVRGSRDDALSVGREAYSGHDSGVPRV